jgi:hypothetical protein
MSAPTFATEVARALRARVEPLPAPRTLGAFAAGILVGVASTIIVVLALDIDLLGRDEPVPHVDGVPSAGPPSSP